MINYYKFRDNLKAYKNKKLRPVVKFLKEKSGVTSNILSLFNLICGVTAAFFLFDNHKLFTIFILLSIFFDILDGALAKVEKKKEEGWIIDVGIDRLIMIVILAKIIIVTDFNYLYAILGIYLLTNLFLIYEKLLIKRDIKMVHIDPSIYIIFIFHFYKLGLILLSASLLLNFILMLLQVSKRAKNIKTESTWANLISVLRPILIIYGLWKFQEEPLILALWIIFVILLDALDGIVARKLKEKSRFGAYVDIAADRAVELIILFVYAYWGIIHYIFPIVFAVRGMTTDFLRILNNVYKDKKFKEPLSIGKADNRFIRGLYGFIKLAAFSVILLFHKFGYALMIITLAMNLYRGLPVIFSKRSKILLKKFLGK
jgi:phosphatidylglycerophosphate synthase